MTSPSTAPPRHNKVFKSLDTCHLLRLLLLSTLLTIFINLAFAPDRVHVSSIPPYRVASSTPLGRNDQQQMGRNDQQRIPSRAEPSVSAYTASSSSAAAQATRGAGATVTLRTGAQRSKPNAASAPVAFSYFDSLQGGEAE